MSYDELRTENERLKAKIRMIYDENLMGYTTKLIIAGKTEGFSYKDADIFSVPNDLREIERTIELLRDKGYVIFLVTAVIDHVDYLIGSVY